MSDFVAGKQAYISCEKITGCRLVALLLEYIIPKLCGLSQPKFCPICIFIICSNGTPAFTASFASFPIQHVLLVSVFAALIVNVFTLTFNLRTTS